MNDKNIFPQTLSEGVKERQKRPVMDLQFTATPKAVDRIANELTQKAENLAPALQKKLESIFQVVKFGNVKENEIFLADLAIRFECMKANFSLPYILDLNVDAIMSHQKEALKIADLITETLDARNFESLADSVSGIAKYFFEDYRRWFQNWLIKNWDKKIVGMPAHWFMWGFARKWKKNYEEMVNSPIFLDTMAAVKESFEALQELKSKYGETVKDCDLAIGKVEKTNKIGSISANAAKIRQAIQDLNHKQAKLLELKARLLEQKLNVNDEVEIDLTVPQQNVVTEQDVKNALMDFKRALEEAIRARIAYNTAIDAVITKSDLAKTQVLSLKVPWYTLDAFRGLIFRSLSFLGDAIITMIVITAEEHINELTKVEAETNRSLVDYALTGKREHLEKALNHSFFTDETDQVDNNKLIGNNKKDSRKEIL